MPSNRFTEQKLYPTISLAARNLTALIIVWGLAGSPSDGATVQALRNTRPLSRRLRMDGAQVRRSSPPLHLIRIGLFGLVLIGSHAATFSLSSETANHDQLVPGPTRPPSRSTLSLYHLCGSRSAGEVSWCEGYLMERRHGSERTGKLSRSLAMSVTGRLIGRPLGPVQKVNYVAPAIDPVQLTG